MFKWWRNTRKTANRSPAPNGRHLLVQDYVGNEANAPSTNPTADTFVEATGGGWGDAHDIIAADGGSQADYVGQQLEKAAKRAESMTASERFTYTLTDIPQGISGPHEITFGLMMRAPEYGLRCLSAINEKI
ncbi:MAG: hypothetical protein ABIR91_02440, partial [Candidatus Saccharimonadales bacterium]